MSILTRHCERLHTGPVQHRSKTSSKRGLDNVPGTVRITHPPPGQQEPKELWYSRGCPARSLKDLQIMQRGNRWPNRWSVPWSVPYPLGIHWTDQTDCGVDHLDLNMPSWAVVHMICVSTDPTLEILYQIMQIIRLRTPTPQHGAIKNCCHSCPINTTDQEPSFPQRSRSCSSDRWSICPKGSGIKYSGSNPCPTPQAHTLVLHPRAENLTFSREIRSFDQSKCGGFGRRKYINAKY